MIIYARVSVPSMTHDCMISMQLAPMHKAGDILGTLFAAGFSEVALEEIQTNPLPMLDHFLVGFKVNWGCSNGLTCSKGLLLENNT